MKSLPDTTDKWKQLAKEQAASLELVTEERDKLQVRNEKTRPSFQSGFNNPDETRGMYKG